MMKSRGKVSGSSVIVSALRNGDVEVYIYIGISLGVLYRKLEWQ